MPFDDSKPLKQIACGRRKPCMTRAEYFDYRFQNHGTISDVPAPDLKPCKYIQTQVFDSAFGKRTDGPLNANQTWCGRDDVTELFFNDTNHMVSTFNSEYVAAKIGPDESFFADLETMIALLAYEKNIPLKSALAVSGGGKEQREDKTTAVYFLSTPENNREGEEVEAEFSAVLVEELERHASEEVKSITASIGVHSNKMDLNAYFGGNKMPQFAVVYKIYLKSAASCSAIRKAQLVFEKRLEGKVDASESFIVFGKEALVIDASKNIRFDARRQLVFHDLG